MTEWVPETVYLLGLLADESRGAWRGLSLLGTFAKLLLLRRGRYPSSTAGRLRVPVGDAAEPIAPRTFCSWLVAYD